MSFRSLFLSPYGIWLLEIGRNSADSGKLITKKLLCGRGGRQLGRVVVVWLRRAAVLLLAVGCGCVGDLLLHVAFVRRDAVMV